MQNLEKTTFRKSVLPLLILASTLVSKGAIAENFNGPTFADALENQTTYFQDNIPVVPSQCFDAAIKGRGISGGVEYLSCSGKNHTQAINPLSEERYRQTEDAFKKVTYCLQINPEVIFPLWAEESAFQENIMSVGQFQVGVSQMVPDSIQDAIETLTSKEKFQTEFETHLKVTKATQLSSDCEAITNKAINLAMIFKKRFGAIGKPVEPCQIKELISGPDALLMNMYFGGIVFLKTLFYIKAGFAHDAEFEPYKTILSKFRFASEQDAEQVMATILREGGRSFTSAKSRIKSIATFYSKGRLPVPLTFEKFAQDFLGQSVRSFTQNKHIKASALMRIKPNLTSPPQLQPPLTIDDCVKYVGPYAAPRAKPKAPPTKRIAPAPITGALNPGRGAASN